MIWRRIAAAVILVLAAAPPAGAGFWGDLKQSFDAALEDVQRDGADAADAVGEAAGDAADAVVEGTESAVDLVTGDTDSDDSAANQSNQISKPPKY